MNTNDSIRSGAEAQTSAEAQKLLHLILDRYESSKAFTSGEETARRVQVSVTDHVVSGYVSGGMDPDVRRAFHKTLEQWAAQGVIRLEWVRFEVGNLLRRVVLEWDGIERAYAILGRTPKRDELAAVREELMDFRRRLSHDWMQRWLDEVLLTMDERKTLPHTLIPTEAEKRDWLLQTLAGVVDKGDEELPMRLFSKRYLGSSKLFEQQVRTRLTTLLRRYYRPFGQPFLQADDSGYDPGYREGRGHANGLESKTADMELAAGALEDEQLLAEIGIELTHEDVAFCGPIRFRIEGADELNLTRFPTGIALDTEVLRRLEITHLPVARILSIENKANYRYYIRNERQAGELVVYLGGFHSPGKRLFLRRLRDFVRVANPGSTTFYHWSDLDYGGILITQSLRETVWPDVKAWRMEPVWLQTYAGFVEPFPNDAYRRRLEGLLANHRYDSFHPLIKELLRVQGTLEQEAFLV